ncbi:MAG: hydantoinase/oxoprolinase family protein [Alphaproteobacteria bacterium]|nr:hydantoinase/oxoprolinase family protein [Alphaproteobacteria bacterium]
MRIACDVGGTFTDLLVEDGARLRMYKASTTPRDPADGVLAALDLAARDVGEDRAAFLGRAHTFIHGTTRAINAILTGAVARTALLTTAGHRDVLVIREGGRIEPFNFRVPYPDPYVPRALTFGIPERIDATGRVLRPLDVDAARAAIERLAELAVEAVAVCLLWSIANPAHEERLGELLAAHLPGVPVTLSHRLNPTVREYRRAVSACLDASLKPLMQTYLTGLVARLGAAGFKGRTLMVTSQGSVMDAAAMAAAPIHAINSGPSMAPVAGGYFARIDADADTAVVADTGGTSYDVSLVRHGGIPWTRETWLGQPHRGDMTGFPSVDVKSVGAGGGSIAWIDPGGLLHVGPRSAGSSPGPVCYGAGGEEPTVTDCALVLGYIDPDYFLGGAMPLDAEAAARAVAARVARPLGLGLHDAAAAVLAVVTETMVGAIGDITVNQGIDPAGTVLVGGGGAAGLNSVAIARRLGCRRVVVPAVGAALSAAGALMSDLGTEFGRMAFTTARRFDAARVNDVLADLMRQCQGFIDGPGADAGEPSIAYSVEARYPHQIWEIDVPVRSHRFGAPDDLDRLIADFHAQHRAIFAIDDPGSDVEFVTWHARVRCRLPRGGEAGLAIEGGRPERIRKIYLAGQGWTEARVRGFASLSTETPLAGPAIVESPFTTVVIDPGASVRRARSGGLVIDLVAEA